WPPRSRAGSPPAGTPRGGAAASAAGAAPAATPGGGPARGPSASQGAGGPAPPSRGAARPARAPPGPPARRARPRGGPPPGGRPWGWSSMAWSRASRSDMAASPDPDALAEPLAQGLCGSVPDPVLGQVQLDQPAQVGRRGQRAGAPVADPVEPERQGRDVGQ